MVPREYSCIQLQVLETAQTTIYSAMIAVRSLTPHVFARSPLFTLALFSLTIFAAYIVPSSIASSANSCQQFSRSTTSVSVTPEQGAVNLTEILVSVRYNKIPNDIVLSELVGGGAEEKPSKVSLVELIQGKRVVIFGVPGAFTPGCNNSHLQSFIKAQDEFKAKSVEMSICVATNDAYVMGM
jgi:Redoxin